MGKLEITVHFSERITVKIIRFVPVCPVTRCSVLLSQRFVLHVPGSRVSRADPQDGDDQRRRSHSSGAQPLLHLQPAHLCAPLPVPSAGLELPQVRQTTNVFNSIQIYPLG